MIKNFFEFMDLANLAITCAMDQATEIAFLQMVDF